MIDLLFILSLILIILYNELMLFRSSRKKFYCPRCGSFEIFDYGNSFECIHCILEFEKKDCESLKDADILAVQEKLKITKILKKNTDIFYDD